ncbi:hypothetical protein CDAR_604611 [Caerostris darwini]|uniref:Uncharacterized protein n=1 Tax=Caerostris darwini TaxID=1538125 RepID=A0AAV4MS93_9ARAC|nr:hypothetical protein CDAR_604611 [Caerostris darwini]
MLWRQLAASDKWVWRREVFPSSATPLRQVACDAKEDPPAHCYDLLGGSKEQQISPMHHCLFLRDTSVIQTLSLSLHLPSVMNDKGAGDAISLPAYCYNGSLTYCVIKATIGGLRNRMKMMKDIFASDIGHLKCSEERLFPSTLLATEDASNASNIPVTQHSSITALIAFAAAWGKECKEGERKKWDSNSN